MATKTLSENITQAISDFDGIKQAIIDKGVEIPTGTPTSQYGTKIGEIQSGGSGSDEEFIKMVERSATEITLPSGLTKIRSYAFYSYSKLTSVEMPDSLTSIGKYAFSKCMYLAITSLPAGITTIGEYAFQSCGKLALTSLPDSLTTISKYAFWGCPKLAITSVPAGITTIGEFAFYNATFKEITFKGTPTSIGTAAFGGCTYLKTIRVPWSSREVSGSPWGATKATIIYNYTE